jgi:hypothetical protein
MTTEFHRQKQNPPKNTTYQIGKKTHTHTHTYSKMHQNPQMLQNGPNSPQCSKMDQILQNGPNAPPKWNQMLPNEIPPNTNTPVPSRIYLS